MNCLIFFDYSNKYASPPFGKLVLLIPSLFQLGLLLSFFFFSPVFFILVSLSNILSYPTLLFYFINLF